MKNERDQFERRLSRQPLRQVPPDWRADILAAARAGQTSRRPSPVTRHSWLSTLNSQLSTIFWPHPKAWAGLAAVWIAIIALNLSTHDDSHGAWKKSPGSPAVVAEVRQHNLFFAELVGVNEARDAEPPRLFWPRPRSERVQILTG